MSDFSFPPPPPPPPRAGADELPGSSFRDRNTGGVFRGRGRGRGQANRSGKGGVGGFSTPNLEQLGRERCHSAGGEHHAGNGHSFRGQKRKRDEFTPHVTSSKAHSRSKVESAPAVPSFGAPLPAFSSSSQILAGAQSSTSSTTSAGAQPLKRKTNQLGLTPLVDYGEQSEDEDGDHDEMILLATSCQNPLRVEFNGQTTDLGSPSAIAAWLSERREKWPTKARVAERKREQLKKEQEALRRRLDADQIRKASQRVNEERERKLSALNVELTHCIAENDVKPKRSLEKQLAKVEHRKRKLEKSEAKLAKATQLEAHRVTGVTSSVLGATDVKLNLSSFAPYYRSTDQRTEQELLDAISSETPSSSSDNDSSDSGDGGSDISGPPEALLSRPKQVEPQVEKHTPKSKPERKLCRQFSATGSCQRGKKCHFKHERAVGEDQQSKRKEKMPHPKRKSLYQRLVEQEVEAENRRALELIKFMGEHGHLDGVATK